VRYVLSVVLFICVFGLAFSKPPEFKDVIAYMQQNDGLSILEDGVASVVLNYKVGNDIRGPITMYCRVVKVYVKDGEWSGKTAYMIPFCVRLWSDSRDSYYPDPVEGRTAKYYTIMHVIFPGAWLCGGSKKLHYGCLIGDAYIQDYSSMDCSGFYSPYVTDGCIHAASFLVETSIHPRTATTAIFGVPLGIIWVKKEFPPKCCSSNRNYADFWFDAREMDLYESSDVYGVVSTVVSVDVPDEFGGNTGTVWKALYYHLSGCPYYALHILWGKEEGYHPIIPSMGGDFVDHCPWPGTTPENYYSSSHLYETFTAVYTGCAKMDSVMGLYSRFITKVTYNWRFTAEFNPGGDGGNGGNGGNGGGDGGTTEKKECPEVWECCEGLAEYKDKPCPEGEVCAWVDDVFRCIPLGTGKQCTTNADCGAHEQCVNGYCRCEPGYMYYNGACIEVPCPEGYVFDAEQGKCVKEASACSDPLGLCIEVGDSMIPVTYLGIGLLVIYLLVKRRPRRPAGYYPYWRWY